MPGKGRRILVVEDELLMQKLLEEALTSLNFSVRTAASVIEAKRVIETFDPDIALIDISLKGSLNGLHLGNMLAGSHPDISQVYLTKHEDARSAVTDGLQFPPGSGFLSKHLIDSADYLIDEINRVVAGTEVVAKTSEKDVSGLSELGPKGLRVLELLAEGYSNQFIAKEMGISTKAVEYYNDSIYRVLGVPRSSDRNPRVDAAVRYQRTVFAKNFDESDSADADGGSSRT